MARGYDLQKAIAAAAQRRAVMAAIGEQVYALPPADRPYGQRGIYPKPPYYPRNAAGLKPCRWCKRETKRGWCSDECVQDFMRRANWPTMAKFIQRRDVVCQLCRGWRPHITEPFPIYDGADGWPIEGGWAGATADAARGLPDRRPYACRLEYSWAVDHILAVKEGGTDDPNNLRLLCGRCHAEVTAAQAARWAAERRASKAASAGQESMF